MTGGQVRSYVEDPLVVQGNVRSKTAYNLLQVGCGAGLALTPALAAGKNVHRLPSCV